MPCISRRKVSTFKFSNAAEAAVILCCLGAEIAAARVDDEVQKALLVAVELNEMVASAEGAET